MEGKCIQTDDNITDYTKKKYPKTPDAKVTQGKSTPSPLQRPALKPATLERRGEEEKRREGKLKQQKKEIKKNNI